MGDVAIDAAPQPPSVLNIRTAFGSSSLGAAPAVPEDKEGISALQSSYSTASMYGALETQANGSSISLWDLRCEIKGILDSSPGKTAEVRTDALQRMMEIMREHVGHRKIQRALRATAKEAFVRVESAERETAALRAQLRALTESLNDSCAKSEGSPLAADAEAFQAASHGPHKLLISDSNTSSTPHSRTGSVADAAARRSMALMSRESMDARSMKSDALLGDELESLMSEKAKIKGAAPKSSPPQEKASAKGPPNAQMRSALLALADERRKNQALEARIKDLQAELKALEAHRAEPHNDGSATQRTWSLFGSMLNKGSSAWPLASGNLSPSAVGAGEVPATFGTLDEVMMQLAATKVSLAEMEGQLTSAKRDLARLKDVNGALAERVESLTEERDASREEVGAIMLQIHMMEGQLDEAGLPVPARPNAVSAQ